MHNPSPIQPIASVTTRPLHWLWPGRIPFAHLTILYGLPGTGLSLTALHLAACVSAARPLPDGLPCPQGTVLLVSPFDSPEAAIKPRLEHAAADTSHIFLLHSVPSSNSASSSSSSAPTPQRPFSLVHDFALLEDTIEHTHPRLVILDTPELCRDQLLRSLLPRLSLLAQRTCAAFLLVRPLSKPLALPLRPSSLHTLPHLSSVHSALLLLPDPEDDQERILLSVKHSLATPTPALSCILSAPSSGTPTLHWLGEYPDPLICSPAADTPSPRSRMRQRILTTLPLYCGPMTARQLSDLLLFNYDALRKTLQRMTASGDLVSPARGLYAFPPSSKPPADLPDSTVPTVPTDPTISTVSTDPTDSSTDSTVPTVPTVPFTAPSLPTPASPTFATSFIPIDPWPQSL